MIDNFECGWEENEHIPAFITRLDDEHAKLLANGIFISEVNINHIAYWRCGIVSGSQSR